MGVLKYILKRQPDSEKWDEVRQIMGTHIYGDVPTVILKRRRPLESENEYALKYRTENFEPFSKEYFNLAISEIIEAADQLSFEVSNADSSTKKFENDLKIRVGCIDFDLKDFCTRYLSVKAESDPNGVVVSMPKHPDQNLIPRYDAELPNFNNVTNRNIDIEIRYVSSKYIWGINESEILFKGGDWVYAIDKDKNELTKPYFWHIAKDFTELIIPKKVKEGFEYVQMPYYNNNVFGNSGTVTNEYFENPPFHIIGHNLTLDNDYVFYESNFSGAVAYFNKAIGIESDLDVSTTKFTYPREFTFYDICNAGCGYSHEFGYNVIQQENGDCFKCNRCQGSGYIQPHTSPLGTTILPRETSFDDNGEFKDPYLFRQPPIDGIKFMHESTFKWIELGINALYVTRQNNTNASAESKSYDIKQKISNRTKGVKNIFRLYQCILNDIQAYLKGAQDIIIELPSDFKVKSSEDITMEIIESKGAPAIYTSSLTTELMLKRYGNNQVNRKILEFLEINDVLYGISSDEALKKKTNYGLVLDARAQYINDKGFHVLRKLASQNENFLNLSDDQLKVLFDTEIDKLIPASVETNQLV